MPVDLQTRVDELLGEFMDAVDAIVEERQLQKGIARSQLPCSMAAVSDKENLSIIAQFREGNLLSTYIYKPDMAISTQKAKASGQWEFGFEDPFVIRFPVRLLDESREGRSSALKKIASDHIESEFIRFQGLLNLIRTRPIFGPAPVAIDNRIALVLLPSDENLNRNFSAIKNAAEPIGLNLSIAGDIRGGKAAVRDLWESINESRIIIADLTGPDPGVMYALGIAHTVGRDTILIHPKGSKYLVDIPRTHRIECEDSEPGRTQLEKDLSEMLTSMLEPLA